MAWKTIENNQGDYPKAWNFETDGNLDGIYLESHKAKSKQCKPITFHDLKIGEEKVSVLGGAVLDRQFAEIQKNTRVIISFLGEKVGKNGTYKNYSVSIWEE